MSLDRLLPMIRTYHSGTKTGAVGFFADKPDLLPWARAELQRLATPIMRGNPEQPCRVSEVHRAALQRMIDEHDAYQRVPV